MIEDDSMILLKEGVIITAIVWADSPEEMGLNSRLYKPPSSPHGYAPSFVDEL